MTPYEIGILLHYYARCDDAPEINAPIGPETVKEFVDKGLLQYIPERDQAAHNPVKLRLTERGYVYVKFGLCKVPLPVQEWRIPSCNGDGGIE